MRIARQFTETGQSPYTGVDFHFVSCIDSGADGQAPFEFPQHWPLESCEMLAHEYMCKSGMAARFIPVREQGVPAWLWRRIPDRKALAALPDGGDGGDGGFETSARQVFDRIAGAWTYTGWKCGYFDTEEDARVFFDEIRFMLCHRMAAPDGPQWRNTGLYWAYGVGRNFDAGCITDYRTGKVTRARAKHLPPSGAFIQGVAGDEAGVGGIFDLWQREARLLGAGLGTASNVSDVSGGSDQGLLRHIKVGDHAAYAVRGDTAKGPDRMITVDADHADAACFIQSKTVDRHRSAALLSGHRQLQRQAGAIRDACRQPRRKQLRKETRNSALRLALHGARAARIPDSYADSLVRLAAENTDQDLLAFDQEITAPVVDGAAAPGDARHVLRIPDRILGAPGGDVLWRRLGETAWSCGATGILFETEANRWNTCATSGAIRSSAAGADYLFLDDSGCGRASLNLPGFLKNGGEFDAEGFTAAVRLWTMALDIAVMMTALPTPRLATRNWEFRPLGLGMINLTGLLMGSGIAYDSDRGRGLCAAVAALMTGAAYAASAEMAEEMGCFPAFEANRASMQGVIGRHHCAAMALHPADTALDRAVRRTWDGALAAGEAGGFRNAQVTLISSARDTAMLMGHDGHGIEPDAAVARFERLPGGVYRKTIHPSVPLGLAALGYRSEQIDAIVTHVLGHGTLASAPGVNFESLRRRGFDHAALERVETALQSAPDIGMAFNPWVLGENFCTSMLGFRAEDLDDPEFNLLAGLGYSDAAIEAANSYCCGADTLEGAPHLAGEHVAVFDCSRPQRGKGGVSGRHLSVECRIRMMAAAQPFVSGAVGDGIRLPEAATVEDCRKAFRLAWRLGLKILIVDRDGAGTTAWESAAPAGRAAFTEASLATAAAQLAGELPEAAEIHGGLMIYPGGRAEGGAPRTEHGSNRQTNRQTNRTCSEGGEQDPARAAETSRRSSPDAARSTASVPSSADAVVEQRQV